MDGLRPLYLYLLLVPSALTAQSITGQELVYACEHALDNNFTGTGGMACYWYVTPCDCETGRQEQPRVCLPHDISEYQLARMVIDGIRNNAELQKMDAAVAVGTVLSQTYPCSD